MGKLKVLFVEDEVDIQDVVKIALGLDTDIELTAFASGTEALKTIKAERRSFQFALLDLHLPHMTGIELHTALRKLPGMAKLRSVLITAAIRDANRDALGLPGIAGVIAKPFDPLMLAGNLRGLLDAYGKGEAAQVVRRP